MASRWANLTAKVQQKAVTTAVVDMSAIPMNTLFWMNILCDRAMVDKCEAELKRVRAFFPVEFKPIKVVLSSSMRSNAGTAFYNKREIHLNYRLLKQNPEELLPTFIHELCHIWTHDKYGVHVSAHGYEWRQMMRSCGYSPDRVHYMDTSDLTRQRQKYSFRCACPEPHLVGSRVANKILRGFTYTCKKCKCTLTKGGSNGQVG